TFLFDLDGTLIDHFSAIHRCHAYAMRKIGLPEPTLAQVRAAVGGGLDEAIARLAGRERVAAILPLFREHWDATNLDDVEVLPGALELVRTLHQRGGQCAAFTNKRGPAAREVCAHLGFTPLLAGVFGAGDTPWLKPDPAFARHVLTELKADASTSCVIGDSPWDVAAAQQAGMAFYGVATGTHTIAELRAAGGVEVFGSMPEIGARLLA
ncbi:MAG TPA: HAD family hydrolase, partial [Candidatus Didemnitutus sp.]|nr:HAD family hydrolase [Candidatus Didemnitutus sp.]